MKKYLVLDRGDGWYEFIDENMRTQEELEYRDRFIAAAMRQEQEILNDNIDKIFDI